MRYPLGVIDLSLACARAWDSSDRAVSFWEDGCPPNDSRSTAYEQRRSCNRLCFDALAAMDDLLNEAAKPNRPTGAVSYEEADGLRTNAYNKALSVKDDLFHFELYEWYLSRGMTNQLLEVRLHSVHSELTSEVTDSETRRLEHRISKVIYLANRQLSKRATYSGNTTSEPLATPPPLPSSLSSPKRPPSRSLFKNESNTFPSPSETRNLKSLRPQEEIRFSS